MAERSEQIKQWLWAGQGVTHLALQASASLTEVVRDMHGTITQRPWPLGAVMAPPAQRAPWPYRLLIAAFRQAARCVVHWPIAGDVSGQQRLGLSLLSAANGVFGDKLEAWSSPLALGMTLRRPDGTEWAWSDLAQGPRPKVALLIHGLCLSEREWQTPVAQDHCALLAQKGWSVGFLRYNSGRAIWRNGADLADWLEEATQSVPVQSLMLVGHSQGGLLIRSAFAHAARNGQRWPDCVRGAAYLATPHQGAPLERLGHRANALLSFSPYTQPLMKLGNLRSAAIRDLSFGMITPETSRGTEDRGHDDPRDTLPPLPAQVAHLLLGGARDAAAADSPVGDGLVPVASALGLHADPARTLTGPRLTRVELADMDHLGMLGDVRVWDALLDWWFQVT